MHLARDRLICHESGRGVLQDRFIILPVRAIYKKGIRLSPADDAAGIRDHFPHTLADAPQHSVTVIRAEALIDHMEMIHVHDDRVHLQSGMVLVELLGIAVEIFPVIKSGQGIALGMIDDLTVFKKLDRTPDTRLDDIFLGIGLGNEIRRAEMEAFDLRVLVCRHDDHRDLPKIRIIPKPF